MDVIIEALRADLKRSPPGRIAEVSAATGIKVRTLQSIKDGYTKNPRISNYEPLRLFYEAQVKRRKVR